ncbi:MAG: TIGR01244 family sulfur transferase [Erythrobacter sp.]|jgi:uncharacterized protein (TIGR01244 family)|nr:TIGR01244 family sulfur transferase [Erythrobacter sp.]
MTDFRRLSDSVMASPQIAPGDIQAAKNEGVGLIVNNRPDGEDPSAPQGADIEAAAREAGLGYRAIPIDHSGFGDQQIDAMATALEEAQGSVLAYCRSGTRSTFLWALARAKAGDDPHALAEAAREAGYDIGPILPQLARLADR